MASSKVKETSLRPTVVIVKSFICLEPFFLVAFLTEKYKASPAWVQVETLNYSSKYNIASFTWQARVADKLIKWFTHASTILEYAYPKHVNVKATRNFFKLLCLIVYSFGIMFLTNKTVRVRFQVWSLK